MGGNVPLSVFREIFIFGRVWGVLTQPQWPNAIKRRTSPRVPATSPARPCQTRLLFLSKFIKKTFDSPAGSSEIKGACPTEMFSPVTSARALLRQPHSPLQPRKPAFLQMTI
jgi:hypothetical protein